MFEQVPIDLAQLWRRVQSTQKKKQKKKICNENPLKKRIAKPRRLE
jgi:hypothetical protein